MSKSVIIFDHDNGKLDMVPIEPGGFLTICEPPMYLASRMDSTEDGTITLVLKIKVLPPSEEGQDFLENGPLEG